MLRAQGILEGNARFAARACAHPVRNRDRFLGARKRVKSGGSKQGADSMRSVLRSLFAPASNEVGDDESSVILFLSDARFRADDMPPPSLQPHPLKTLLL